MMSHRRYGLAIDRKWLRSVGVCEISLCLSNIVLLAVDDITKYILYTTVFPLFMGKS